jgi:hypothetical protein
MSEYAVNTKSRRPFLTLVAFFIRLNTYDDALGVSSSILILIL